MVDGLEEEYGPVPPIDRDIVDWVMLYRMQRGFDLPRKPTNAEQRAFRERV